MHYTYDLLSSALPYIGKKITLYQKHANKKNENCTCSTECVHMKYRTPINAVHAPTLEKKHMRQKNTKKKLTTQVLPAPASLIIGLRPQKASRSESQCMGPVAHGPTGHRAYSSERRV